MRALLTVLLSLCLGAFLADAVVSAVDDSLILFLGIRILSTLRGIVFLFALLMLVVTYFLIGLTPMVPKRIFLPLTLFIPLAELVAIPVMIYGYERFRQIAWLMSISQLAFGLGVLFWLQGGFKLQWPLFSPDRIAGRQFSWRNLSVFALANVFVLLPAIAVYLYFCSVRAVDHFSDGFMALRTDGFTVQARKYVRADGKSIQLFPMSHIGERDFYRNLSESFSNNSIILMEGVSDEGNLLTNRISYQQAAESLQLTEQQKEFKPVRGRLVRADLDVSQFTPGTIAFLNLVMLFHARGVDPDVVRRLLLYSPPPRFEEQLVEDLIQKRNRHLIQEIHAQLLESEKIVVPWGVMHMPEVAREIQKSGFRLHESRDYTVIRFHSGKGGVGSSGKRDDPDRRK